MSFAGELGLWVGLLMAGWSALASFAGEHWRRADLEESGARGLYATALVLGVATLGLWVALLRHDFSLTLVAATTSLHLPPAYRVAALWSTPSGATLMIALMTGISSSVALRALRTRRDPVAAAFAGSASLFLLFLLLLIRAGADPYDVLPVPPVDGAGMHPSLQRPGMLVHPPLLALAIGIAAVPCIVALCCIAVGRISGPSRILLRRGVALSWGLLTLAMGVGMWWTHVTRTAGRSWPLDPFVHGTIVPGLLLGTFLAWHPRADRGAAARTALVLPVAAVVVAIPLLLLTQLGLTLAPVQQIASPVGVAIVAFILVSIGSTAALARERVTASPAADDTAPVADAASSRARGRAFTLGGLVAIVGAVLLTLGIAGHAARRTSTVDLRAGESAVRVDPFGREWRLVHEGTSVYPVLNRRVLAVGVGLFRDAKRVGTLAPELREYVTGAGDPTHAPASVPAIRSRAEMDVVLSVAERDATRVRLRVDFEPLAIWAWVGGLLLAIGGATVGWPRGEDA